MDFGRRLDSIRVGAEGSIVFVGGETKKANCKIMRQGKRKEGTVRIGDRGNSLFSSCSAGRNSCDVFLNKRNSRRTYFKESIPSRTYRLFGAICWA